MKNFFQSEKFTEILTESNERWVYGDALDAITVETPRMYIGNEHQMTWGNGSEASMDMPVTDDHGDVIMVKCRVFEGNANELSGTIAQDVIEHIYYFNANGGENA